jgi:hypothetical protein
MTARAWIGIVVAACQPNGVSASVNPLLSPSKGSATAIRGEGESLCPLSDLGFVPLRV